jgi:hypothetical protein
VASEATGGSPSEAVIPIIRSVMSATSCGPTSKISCANTTLTESSVALQRSMLPYPPPSAFETQWSSSSHREEHQGDELEYVASGEIPRLKAPARTNGLKADPGWCGVVARSSSSRR